MSNRARSSIQGVFLIERGAERWAEVIRRAAGSRPPGRAAPAGLALHEPVQLPPVHPQFKSVDARDLAQQGQDATLMEDCLRRREESNRALEEWQAARRMWFGSRLTTEGLWAEAQRVRGQAEVAGRENRLRDSAGFYVQAAELMLRDIRTVSFFLRRLKWWRSDPLWVSLFRA
jgi:hypothetical protein